MYLIIGHEHDTCARAVKARLEQRNQCVVLDPNPFGEAAGLRWQFDSTSSHASYRHRGDADANPTLQGVFVRHFVGLQATAGWTTDDQAYMRSESLAALLAWLHTLECPVVGRVSDDGWYRPTRPLPEWVGVLASCGLPTPKVVVTSGTRTDAHERDWQGRATYQPLTSARRYPIEGAGWAELGRVMQHVPVCLTEPNSATPGMVTFVRDAFFWSDRPSINAERFEAGIRRLAQRLEADFVQLSYLPGDEGPTFTAVHLAPFVECHSEIDQLAMADRIAEVLS